MEKIKFVQGYLKVKLTGYAPERFLNLCSNRNILIWNLTYNEDHYEFHISVEGFKSLKPILRKTKTRMIILERHGVPFFFHRYRKRKLFFGGIVICACILYAMSLFIWKIEINGNSHRTDSTIIKYLSQKNVYHGIFKSKINCEELEELLRSAFDDVIWASAKIQGTRLIIDITENLGTNQVDVKELEDQPYDLVSDKKAQIFSIITRAGMPVVIKGHEVEPGDMLVEGKIPIYNDYGDIVSFKYCLADADIFGVTTYEYNDAFSLEYEDKVFTGEEKTYYRMMLFNQQLSFQFMKSKYTLYDIITEEFPLKLSENFYLPFIWYQETEKEYKIEKKKYNKEEAKALADKKLNEFCENLKEKGVQIVENNVMIVTDAKNCQAKGNIIVIEPIGKKQLTEIVEMEIQEEGQMTDESDGNND